MGPLDRSDRGDRMRFTDLAKWTYLGELEELVDLGELVELAILGELVKLADL